jgi:hypothetical protein
VPDQQHRTWDLIHDAGDVGGVTGHAAQRIGRRLHHHPGGLQCLDDARPAAGIGEGAVDQDNGRRGLGIWGRLRHLNSFL